MVLHVFLAKAASTVVTGAVGVAAYQGVRKAVAKAPIREASVTATAWALRGVRKAEESAESARLKVADVVAEVEPVVGRRGPAPGAGGQDTPDTDRRGGSAAVGVVRAGGRTSCSSPPCCSC